MSRILIAAAGTGGHVFPALAVAQELRAEGHQVEWVGTQEQRIEAKVVPQHDIPLHRIAMTGLRGHGVKRLLTMPKTLLSAWRQVRKLFQTFQPDLVLTFGGYVCAPVGWVAHQRGVPLLTHEQNAVPGMTTLLLARWAQLVLLGLPLDKSRPKSQRLMRQSNVYRVGNPLRQEIIAAADARPAESHHDSINLLIVGGSLGARVFNQTLPEALARINGTVNVTHQVGAGNKVAAEQSYQAVTLKDKQVQVVEFIDDMASAYAAADIIISRAGALSVSEICGVGRAAVFVPLPHAVDDHQTANARAVAEAGGAVVIAQSDFTADGLAKSLQSLLQAPSQLWKMASFSRSVGELQATDHIVQLCRQILAGESHPQPAVERTL
ncbi:undecaprenyldiphospho-muramoylpentapeptide beta-N-acetylglucosaminyltransferase [Idiomarina sp. MD25a]|uniref:undecaprenyldiphospho-muramoylpentapeptide beta-N-acetylglucosaminyltransferase n=1 Tax=Idiomarina sp. MD25a TaxID=1889913 RepID=UPI0008F81775|nr:undecaprenyldiphospho-muramoylpentapeptide beta-N-acetylglucosaminyltransferase [Idiomarina sp. MD25a]OIM99315.1 undecaprenyldiphospho-muramoylpentapeptide beta-N-acetylglucosaminyltransferase [Idiomarina sp. MD25a]